MAKKKTVVTTPTKRPETLDAEFELVTKDDVDAALNELGWCEQRVESINADLKALHLAVENKRPAAMALTIGETKMLFGDRLQALGVAIQNWTESNLKPLLPNPEDRTLKLTHGSLSYRKLPLGICLQEGINERIVLERIAVLAGEGGPDPIFMARQICGKLIIKALKLLLGDLVNVSVSLNFDGMVDAYKAGRLDDKTLKKLGLVARDDRERYSFKAN